ncbi:hypothetical protein BT93_F1581 [Corymbia citriodora subsp. variegata]|nr:hypothetical protein BT93_F1581 [Corymbia citriodora subsp. variegata]
MVIFINTLQASLISFNVQIYGIRIRIISTKGKEQEAAKRELSDCLKVWEPELGDRPFFGGETLGTLGLVGSLSSPSIVGSMAMSSAAVSASRHSAASLLGGPRFVPRKALFQGLWPTAKKLAGSCWSSRRGSGQLEAKGPRTFRGCWFVFQSLMCPEFSKYTLWYNSLFVVDQVVEA